MSPEAPSSDAAAWHASLRAADDAAHEAEARRVATSGVGEVQARLVRANADRLALREGLAFRDALLRRFLAQERQLLRRAARRVERLVRGRRRR